MMTSSAPYNGVLDRAETERTSVDLLLHLRADPATRVLVLYGDQAPLDGRALRWSAPANAPVDAHWAFLGRDGAGVAHLVAAAPNDSEVPEGETWAALRVVGGELRPQDSDAFATGVSLGRWLSETRYCPACGGVTDVHRAGWARLCPDCGREHFPRTDPAVIVAVSSTDHERLLLGSNVLWGGQRFSCFAGFVEAGESLESAAVREVYEEAGVKLVNLDFQSSQPWPYPRSLMVGFQAEAVDETAARPDGEEIVDVRWFTRAEIQDALNGTGDFQLPGTASVARALISAWVERKE